VSRQPPSQWRWQNDRLTDKPTKPPAPQLDTSDNRPVAGRLLGPHGELLRVVRYGDDVPFGFQPPPHNPTPPGDTSCQQEPSPTAHPAESTPPGL
jgi:hypothetical protein